MGTDISGWIEVKDKRYDSFEAVSPVGAFLHRNYSMFGYLFGVRLTVEEPLFGDRGIPDNESWRVREDLHNRDILIQKQEITMKRSFPNGATYQKDNIAGTTEETTKPLEKGETYSFKTDIVDDIPKESYESHGYEYEHSETTGGHNLSYFTLEEFKNRVNLEDKKKDMRDNDEYVVRFYTEKDGKKQYLGFYSRHTDQETLTGRESRALDKLKDNRDLEESEIDYEIDEHRIKDMLGLDFVQMLEYMEYLESIPKFEDSRCIVWFGS